MMPSAQEPMPAERIAAAPGPLGMGTALLEIGVGRALMASPNLKG